MMEFFYSKDGTRSATVSPRPYGSAFKYEVSLSRRTKTRGRVERRVARTKKSAVALAKDWVRGAKEGQ